MSIGTHKLRPIESHHSYSICVLSASEDYQDCINHVLQVRHMYGSLKSRVYIWLLANIIVLTFVRVQPSKWV